MRFAGTWPQPLDCLESSFSQCQPAWRVVASRVEACMPRGKLTVSGYPMMMNDPHRELSAPSLRYWVHLVAPGWNVIGGGEPSLPGVSIGHNETIAADDKPRSQRALAIMLTRITVGARQQADVAVERDVGLHPGAQVC